jgi:ATP phosphoribosyltransferase regulatory subunit HisZ
MLAAKLRKLRLAARRKPVDDPDLEERRQRAIAQMHAFDQLGEQARRAIADSRFDADADAVLRKYGGPYAEDERVAARILKNDDSFSGAFGPVYPRGI